MISAIVLAAGASQRMPGANKLLLRFRHMPLVRHVVQTVCEAPADEVLIVTGYDATQVQRALKNLPVRILYNERFAEGLTTSIQAGVRATTPAATGLMVCLADMPLVTSENLALLTQTFVRAAQQDAQAIVRATWKGVPGHPVIFAAAYREMLLSHTAPSGCRAVIRRHQAHAIPVAIAGSAVDVDTMGDYERLTKAHTARLRSPEVPGSPG